MNATQENCKRKKRESGLWNGSSRFGIALLFCEGGEQMSMLEELWLCGLDYQGRPVKKGSAMERKLCLYAKNGEKLKTMLSEQQAEQYTRRSGRAYILFRRTVPEALLKAFSW